MSEAVTDLAGAYAGFERLESFTNGNALEAYRESMLARSAPEADFLLERFPRSASVLEVACGNGRLLIELANRGALAEGAGLDIAASRIEFAQRWASDQGHALLRFEVADIAEAELDRQRYNAVACISGAFGYFEPLARGSALRLARKLREALEPGGLLCLELYPSQRHRRLAEIAGGEVRLWTDLPEEDPWRFYLSHLRVDGSILVHRKTFVHRHTGEVDTGRTERLYLYSPNRIVELLEQAGLEDVQPHEGWSDAPYEEGESMVVTARRPAG